MRKITHIVVHTAGASLLGIPLDQSAASIRRYHQRKRGWSDIGYHYVIRFNGRIEDGRPVETVGAHVQGFNSNTIGICLTGHGDIRDFTDDQHESLVFLIAELAMRHSLVDDILKNPKRVLGHNECYDLPGVVNTGKSCPGSKVSMPRIRRAVLRRLSE